MLPSRGVPIAHRALASSQNSKHSIFSGYRQLSATSSIYSRNSIRWRAEKSRMREVQTRQFSIVPSFISSRFQSAEPAPAPAPSSPPADIASKIQSTSSSAPAVSEPSGGLPDASSVADQPIVSSTSTDSLEFTNTNVFANATEHIGYLRELGIDFGTFPWPSATMQMFYEHVHIYSGLPWGLSIVLAAAIYRCVILLYPTLLASDQTARQMAMMPATKKLQERKEKGEIDYMQYTRELSQVHSVAGISHKKMILPFIVQGTLGYGTFTLLRAMANLPVPGLETAGFWWITDLTQSDPFCILPIALFASMHVVAKRGYESGTATPGPTAQILAWVVPGFFSSIMLFMPATLQLSFFTTSILGLGQGMLLQVPRVRSALGLYPKFRPEDVMPSANPRVIDVNKVQKMVPKKGRYVQTQSDMMATYEVPGASAKKKDWLENKKDTFSQGFSNFLESSRKQMELWTGDKKKTKTYHEKQADEWDKGYPRRQWRR